MVEPWGIEPPDLLIANEALYHLSYGPLPLGQESAAHKRRGVMVSRMSVKRQRFSMRLSRVCEADGVI